jgi:hypothetical protein
MTRGQCEPAHTRSGLGANSILGMGAIQVTSSRKGREKPNPRSQKSFRSEARRRRALSQVRKPRADWNRSSKNTGANSPRRRRTLSRRGSSRLGDVAGYLQLGVPARAAIQGPYWSKLLVFARPSPRRHAACRAGRSQAYKASFRQRTPISPPAPRGGRPFALPLREHY